MAHYDKVHANNSSEARNFYISGWLDGIQELTSLVKKMREAQITYWDSINISKPDRPSPMSIVYLVKAQDLEREVDEYLKKI